MKKIIDFDRKFFEYAREWMARHPQLTDEQVEDSYSEIMAEWIDRPADWLDGASPAEYFESFTEAQDLIELMEGYAWKKIELPEPLYSRIMEMKETCAPLLREILQDEGRDAALRAQAMGILGDMGDSELLPILENLIVHADAQDELSDMAVELLSRSDSETASRLLDAYEAAPAYAQDLMLEVLSNFPGDGRIYDYLIQRLNNRPEERRFWASCLGKLGDERAIEPLKKQMQLTEINYLDYLALRDAVEMLGGDVGEERSFYGDNDFEALRNLE